MLSPMATVNITAAAAGVLGDPHAAGTTEVTGELRDRVAELLASDLAGNGRQAIQALAAKIAEADPEPSHRLAEDAPAGGPVDPPSAETSASTEAAHGNAGPVEENPGGDFLTIAGTRYAMEEVLATELAAGDGIAVLGTDGQVLSVVRVDRVVTIAGTLEVDATAIAGRRRGRVAERLAPTHTVIRLRA